ncbi:MAG TPA: M61 family peptidase, partial [Terriglobia bacterium]|nr:M61 family peptidase [Terriglobia bacterium]
QVDATQAPMKIIHTHMEMPVHAGPLTLYYPKWIPGEHAPDGPVLNLTGLKFTANGKTIPWRRDLLDMFTLHLTIPEGVIRLDADLDYIEPQETSGFSAGASATDKLVVISWNQNLLYPAGERAQQITYQPTLRLPEGWKFGTALPIAQQSGDEIEFKPVSLNRLVDSPVIAGSYLRVVNVTPPGEPIHHEMDIAADSEAALNISDKLQKDYTNLVAETGALFETRHYRDYHFLLTLSDHVAHFGLEHHESDDSRVWERSLIDSNRRELMADLLPHEFFHSWNGKFRRPADLSPPYYEESMKTDLLWVYEGLTDYFGNLLAARCGLWTPKQYREHLALISAELGPGRPGRTWRPLQDTADAAQILYFAPDAWTNWRRSTDYYQEGDLVWLDVNTTIRRLTHGQKSLKDFCRLFYGGPNQGPQLKTYTFDDLVNALNQVAPYDWAGFFRKLLESTSPEPPLAGIEAAGWKVTYNDQEPEMLKAAESVRHRINTAYSIGLLLRDDGDIVDCVVNSPAYKAGIAAGMRVMAVNGRNFTPSVLRDMLEAGKTGSEPLKLLVLNDDYYKTYSLDYHGGERYPHLVRIEGKPDLLDEISKPLAAAGK